MTKHSLVSNLSIISQQFQDSESELNKLTQVWNFLCVNYNGHPLTNIDELLSNKKDMQELFVNMGLRIK